MARRALALALAVCACGRSPAAASNVAPAEVSSPELVGFQWQIREFRVALQPPPGQAVVGVDGEKVRAEAALALADVALVGTIGAPRDPSPASWCGVDIQVGWQAEDAAGMAVALDAPAAVALGVQIRAQAESAASRPDQAEVALRVATVQLPKPASASLAAWLPPRLGRAVAQVTADVLAELWARRRTDAEIVQGLLDADVWKVSACAREAGDRKLVAERPRLEKLCRDTRKDVALVACTALGRLGGDQSVPVLAQAVQARQPEVVAAALDALDMLHTPAAQKALSEVAREHPVELVRARAEQILGDWERRDDAN